MTLKVDLPENHFPLHDDERLAVLIDGLMAAARTADFPRYRIHLERFS